MKKIDLEVHFVTQGWVDALEANPGFPRLARDPQSGNRRLYYQADAAEPYPDALLEKLLDVDAGRIAAMDAAGVDLATLSLTSPGVEQLEPATAIRIARESNDELAEAMDRHPGRLQGYAAVYPKDVDGAVKELERAVKELGLMGWKTHSNFGDSYLDDKQYWPLLAKAEELDIPIYLHPTVPKIKEFWTYGLALAGPPFGFGVETALTMVRLILSGALDAFPNLMVIVGHYGEGLPFLLDRIDFAANFSHVSADSGAFVPLKRRPSDYLRQNMWISTSCNYLPAAFLCSRDAMGMDRIVFGSDYPYGKMDECLAFLGGRGLSPAEEEMLYEANAARLGVAADGKRCARRAGATPGAARDGRGDAPRDGGAQ